MVESASRDRFVERLVEPPTKTGWLLLGLTDALGLVGVYTGVLGIAWFALTPTVCCWTVHFIYTALRRPSIAPAATPTGARREP